MRQYWGNHLGICINNADPEKRGRIQVFVPHIMPALFEEWNVDGKDITIECVGDNIPNGLSSSIVERLIKILPWAEAASPIVGMSGGGGNVTSGNSIGEAIAAQTGNPVPGVAAPPGPGEAQQGSVLDQSPTTVDPGAMTPPPMTPSGPIKFDDRANEGKGEKTMPGGLNGDWGGSISILSSLLPDGYNYQPSSTKRRYPPPYPPSYSNNPRSDHNFAWENAYGVDLAARTFGSGLTTRGSEAYNKASACALQIWNNIRAQIGKAPYPPGTPWTAQIASEAAASVLLPNGYRTQLKWWDDAAHRNHIHFGVKYQGPTKSTMAESAKPPPVAPSSSKDGGLKANDRTVGSSTGVDGSGTEQGDCPPPAGSTLQSLGGSPAPPGITPPGTAPASGTPAPQLNYNPQAGMTGTVSGGGTSSGGGTQCANFPPGGTRDQAYAVVRAAAVAAGSPDPDLTASIAVLESGDLKSKLAKKNNVFGQTMTAAQVKAVETTGSARGGLITGYHRTKGKNADGQPHAHYPDLESGLKHHLDKWKVAYSKPDGSSRLRQLYADGYNTANPGWFGHVKANYEKYTGKPLADVPGGMQGPPPPPGAPGCPPDPNAPPSETNLANRTSDHGPLVIKNTNDSPNGLFAYPAVGAMIWVFFREGNPLFPVYFAASFGKDEWSGAYRQGSAAPGIAYNGEGPGGGFSHGTEFKPTPAGGISTVYTVNPTDPSKDQKSIMLFADDGSNVFLGTGYNQYFSQHDRIDYVTEDRFNTTMGYKEQWVQGDSNTVIMGDCYIKIGDVSQRAVNAMEQIKKYTEEIQAPLLKANAPGGGGSEPAKPNSATPNMTVTIPESMRFNPNQAITTSGGASITMPSSNPTIQVTGSPSSPPPNVSVTIPSGFEITKSTTITRTTSLVPY